MKYFNDLQDFKQQTFNSYSSSEVFYIQKFFDFDGDYLIKLLLLENCFKFSKQNLSSLAYFFNMIALSRAWKTFDSKIVSYSGDDFCNSTLSINDDLYSQFL